MDLLTMMYTVQQIAQTYDKTLDMSLEQYNNYLDISQNELFKEFADGYSVGNGLGSNSKVNSALAQLTYIDLYTSSNWTTSSANFGIPGLVFNLDSEVYRLLTAWAVDTGSAYPDKIVKIDIVNSVEAVERMNNSITYPTTDFPILYHSKESGASAFSACVMPTGFTQIGISSLYRPTQPSLVLSYSNDVPSQGGSSVDLMFTDEYRIDIIRIILKYLGLGVGNDQVRAFVEQQKTNEK